MPRKQTTESLAFVPKPTRAPRLAIERKEAPFGAVIGSRIETPSPASTRPRARPRIAPPRKMPAVKYRATSGKMLDGSEAAWLRDVAPTVLNVEDTVEWKKPEMPSTSPNLESRVCNDAAIISPPARLWNGVKLARPAAIVCKVSLMNDEFGWMKEGQERPFSLCERELRVDRGPRPDRIGGNVTIGVRSN